MANISHMILLFFMLRSFGNAAGLTDHNPPAVFIFGDSSADVGTNNYIRDCPYKSNFSYYGIDYPDHNATGRWSNAYNTADYLSKLMGFKESPPPFLSRYPRKGLPTEIPAYGFNFASAGSGLLNSTAKAEDVVPVLEQIDEFMRIRDIYIGSMGEREAEFLISRSIFIMSVGNNDILRIFLQGMPISERGLIVPYMANYKHSIKSLYSLGARKFGFVSTLPLGCVPMIRIRNETEGCLHKVNYASRRFYQRLKELLITLERELEDFKYSLGNTFTVIMDIIRKSTHPACACCGFGELNAEYFCNGTANLCHDREKYTFWDGAHPTDAAAEIVAKELYNGGSFVTYPINFGQLVADTYSM